MIRPALAISRGSGVQKTDLMAACYLVHGYISDDVFLHDFPSWLILQGREIFESALADAHNLADLPIILFDGYACAGDADTLVTDPYDAVAGREQAYWDFVEEAEPPPSPNADEADEGEPLPKTAEEAALRWPRLWARFGDQSKARGWRF